MLKISGDEIINTKNGNMILTHSMKMTDGTMSAKGKGLSNVTHLLIDEATEMPSEEEYIKLIDSFRTKGSERKIFVCFNPTSKNHWIYKRWYMPDGSPNPKWQTNHNFLHTTFRDNIENLDPTKVQEWLDMRETDPDYFDHHIEGNWRDSGAGAVYKKWTWFYAPDPESEVVLGLDFGFANDPTALVQVNKKGSKLWIRELLYTRGLTTEDLSDAMRLGGVPKHATIIADSSDPRSIQTLRRLGWSNISPCVKGPDSIRHGIDAIRSYQVFADPSSSNLRDEYENYVYREGTDKPIDGYNHLLDAVRYAVGTRMKIGMRTGYSVMTRAKSEFDLYF
jgi:phage terminase large subunit